MRSKLTDVQHWMQQQQQNGPQSRSLILRSYGEDLGQLQEGEDMSIGSACMHVTRRRESELGIA